MAEWKAFREEEAVEEDKPVQVVSNLRRLRFGEG